MGSIFNFIFKIRTRKSSYDFLSYFLSLCRVRIIAIRMSRPDSEEFSKNQLGYRTVSNTDIYRQPHKSL